MCDESDESDHPLIPRRHKSAEVAKRLARRVANLDAAALRRARREIVALAALIDSDYRELTALPSTAAARELSRMVAEEREPLRQRMRRGNLRLPIRQVPRCCDEIAMRAAPYTTGAGLKLWGFSCAMGDAEQHTFVIYLNTAHQPGAVAMTAAHELGHYFEHTMSGGPTLASFAPMAADFAGHLRNRGELFADSAAAMAAFDGDAADAMAPCAREGTVEIAMLAHDLAQPAFRIDLRRGAMSASWRLRYLAAAIHYAKLRVALRETADI
jgi:hypothetical protein